MYLGGQEMRKVLKRDDTTIGKHLDKVRKAPPTRGANESESQIRVQVLSPFIKDSTSAHASLTALF